MSESFYQTLNVLSQVGRVRFDTEEIDALAYALDGLAPERVAIFGLRVEPDRRGSDVDLLFLSDALAYDLSKRVATRFFSRCEAKIDAVVLPGATPEQQAFLDLIKGVDLVWISKVLFDASTDKLAGALEILFASVVIRALLSCALLHPGEARTLRYAHRPLRRAFESKILSCARVL